MAKTETLYSVDYIAGELPNVNRKSIGEMVLRSYLAGNNMDKDESSIRNEDIRIDYNDDIKQLAESLQSEWKKQVYEQYGVTDKSIELYWENDPNLMIFNPIHYAKTEYVSKKFECNERSIEVHIGRID